MMPRELSRARGGRQTDSPRGEPECLPGKGRQAGASVPPDLMNGEHRAVA